MAFNLLSQLVNRPLNDEEIGVESDVECGGEEDNDSSSVDLDSDLDLHSNDGVGA